MTTQCIGYLQRAASKHDVNSMWILGEAYLDGYFEVESGCNSVEYVVVNRRLARKWLKRAADAGCTGAMLSLAALYAQSRRHRTHNLLQALELEKTAWRCGDEFAAYNVAVTYSELGERRLSVEWLRKYYRSTGDGIALALSLLLGYGVRQNRKQAISILDEMIESKVAFEDDVRVARMLKSRIQAGALYVFIPGLTLTELVSRYVPKMNE